ncbi:SAM-dependent methyltransferase [Nocardioides alkalitolerans]|uniref:SAM-dependent methyltransferase n=1 Tax=Nocardioides alkalitolerans TaxID=281714 RepID=UPI000427700B|nr:class I SAM-dependent methyltransferase [Nocardioides alkalitolerans]
MSTLDGPSAAFWDDRYRTADPGWGTQPNAVLRRLLDDLAPTPGDALDLGAGHGGDALWLAAAGWRVRAVDVARTALDRIDAAAAERGLADRVATEAHDLTATFPDGTFDLVTASYFQTPVKIDRDAILRRATDAVRRGGLLVVVDHGSFAPWSWRPDDHPGFPTPDELATSIGVDGAGAWELLVCAAPEREATGPDGEQAMVADTVVVARRTA